MSSGVLRTRGLFISQVRKKDSYIYPTAGGGRENQVNPTDAYMLAFLGGEFDYGRERIMNVGNSLALHGRREHSGRE